MNFTVKLLVASAAALAAVAGAAAADLPAKQGGPAADYVKLCKGGGAAGFAIPGSDACLAIGGYLSAEVAFAAGADWAAARRDGDIGYLTRGQLDFDALTNTAQGPLLGHVELRAKAGDGHVDWTSAQAGLGAAYVQWSGFTVGKHDSFFWPGR